LPYSVGTNPYGFLVCDGSAISRSTYASLYAVIGTIWGIGDGSTTFNIPDLRGIFLRGIGSHGSLNQANGGNFSGTLGTYQNDKFQAWQLGADEDLTGSRDYWGFAGERDKLQSLIVSSSYAGVFLYRFAQGVSNKLYAKNDGTYGAIRQGAETNPVNAGVNFIIKY
jgi:phage-related tail fiber protein